MIKNRWVLACDNPQCPNESIKTFSTQDMAATFVEDSAHWIVKKDQSGKEKHYCGVCVRSNEVE